MVPAPLHSTSCSTLCNAAQTMHTKRPAQCLQLRAATKCRVSFCVRANNYIISHSRCNTSNQLTASRSEKQPQILHQSLSIHLQPPTHPIGELLTNESHSAPDHGGRKQFCGCWLFFREQKVSQQTNSREVAARLQACGACDINDQPLHPTLPSSGTHTGPLGACVS
jgi:hypothetical protein